MALQQLSRCCHFSQSTLSSEDRNFGVICAFSDLKVANVRACRTISLSLSVRTGHNKFVKTCTWRGHTGNLGSDHRLSGWPQCQAALGGSTSDAGEGSEEAGENSEIEDARRRLAQSFQSPSSRISGKQLRELVFAKYGRSYDVRLTKQNNRVYMQIMWKHLEQRSFPLTEEMYMEQLDAVAEFLNIWGVVDNVRDMLSKTKHRPGYTGGGGAKAVSLPLDIGRGTGRGKEWMDHF